MDSFTLNALPSVAVDENTFYKAGRSGIHRTRDGGESWHLFMDGIVGTRILDLIVHNNKLYAHTSDNIVQSTDSGESWKAIRFDVNEVKGSAGQSRLKLFADSRLTIAGNIFCAISHDGKVLRVFRLSTDGDVFSLVQDIPAFEVDASSIGLLANSKDAKQIHLSQEHCGVKNMRRSGLSPSVARRFMPNISENFSNGSRAIQNGRTPDWWILANRPTRIRNMGSS